MGLDLANELDQMAAKHGVRSQACGERYDGHAKLGIVSFGHD